MNNNTSFLNSTEPENCTNHDYDDILQRYCGLALKIDRYVTPIWYIIGVSGNIISSKIWLERRMRRNNSSAIYLAALSINDTLFLVLHMLLELKYAWFYRTVDYPVICEAYALIYIVTNYLAPTLVLGFTIERFIAVCYPYQKMKYCTSERAWKVVLGLTCICFLLGGIQPFFWEYHAEKKTCEVVEEHLNAWANWSWATEMLIFLVVPIVILIINILVLREIRKMSGPTKPMMHNTSVRNHVANSKPSTSSSTGSNRHASATDGQPPASCVAATNVLLLSVSFYVICTTLPATIVYVLASIFPEGDFCMEFEAMGVDPQWVRHFGYVLFRKIVDEFCLSHYACNVVLYTITGKMFRQSVVSLARCRIGSAGNRKSDQTTKYYSITRTNDVVVEPSLIITKL